MQLSSSLLFLILIIHDGKTRKSSNPLSKKIGRTFNAWKGSNGPHDPDDISSRIMGQDRKGLLNKLEERKSALFEKRLKPLFHEISEEIKLPMTRLSFTSKYLWDNQNNKTVSSYSDLQNECSRFNLSLPEIRNEADVRVLSTFLMLNPQLVVGLGINDKKEAGKFLESDGETKIAYQVFRLEDLEKDNTDEHCVVYRTSVGGILMHRVGCEAMNAHLFCQRPDASISYKDTIEYMSMDSDAIAMIGDVGGRRYFASQTQKSWERALGYCEVNGKNLLDLELSNATVGVNQQLFSIIEWWRNFQGYPQQVGFWTSGKLDPSSQESFEWVSSGSRFVGSSSVRWVPSENPTTKDHTNYKLCVDISVPPQQSNGSSAPILRPSNCHIPFYFICYETLNIDSACKEKGPMKLTGMNSKFLYDSSETLGTRGQAKDFCEKWDYQLAEIQSFTDLAKMTAFINGNQFQDKLWHLGMTDEDMEGEFVEDADRVPIQYQAFALSQPDNKGNEDCVVLKFDKNINALVIEDRSCTSQMAHSLCQFPKATSCFQNSGENVQKAKDGLMYFGETAVRRYYISYTQKTWAQAMEFCSSRGKKLLDLLFIEEMHSFKNQVVLPKLVGWARKYRTGIWTSGKFLRSVDDGEFRWETTNTMFKTYDTSLNFTWISGEPSDTTNRRLEKCLELVVEAWTDPSQVIPTLKASDCKLTNNYVCYEEAPHVKHCHLPPKMAYATVPLAETERFVYVETGDKRNAKDRHKTCKGLDLEEAEVSSLRDYKIVTQGLEKLGTVTDVGLGLNSVGNEGQWYEQGRQFPVRFQVFGHDEPQYYSSDVPLDHVVLQKQNTSWTMVAVAASTESSVLCQFRRDSSYYVESRLPKDTVELLNSKYKPREEGSGGKLLYHIADTQQTWEDAMRFCWSRRLKLLDLSINTTDLSDMTQLLQQWTSDNGLDSTTVRFWTSGKFVETYSEEFKWETTSTFVSQQELRSLLNISTLPPPLTTTPNNERCLSLLLLPLEGTSTLSLQTSNCFLPYYTVCTEPVVPKPPKVTPPKPLRPPEVKERKDRPSCDMSSSSSGILTDKEDQAHHAHVLQWAKNHHAYITCNFSN